MDNSPLITIVTPVFNGEKYLEETIQSVINQKYKNFEYIIIDGGSTDNTINIIKKYESHLTYWTSEPDKGMYDAINKGFLQTRGEICAWLNADDKYYPGTLEAVVTVFNNFPDIEWITGVGTYYDKNGITVGVGLPNFYFQSLFKKGLYRGDILGSVQQESTFWKKTLWDKSGGLDSTLQYAGDYHLWIKFSEYTRLYQIPTIFSGFRYHDNQKTTQIQKYFNECDMVKPITFRILWNLFRIPIKCISLLVAILILYKGRNKIIKMQVVI